MKKRSETLHYQQLQAILESISDGVFTVNADWRITSFNRAAEIITGISRDEALGKPCCDVFKADACESACPLRKTLKNGKPIINRTAHIIDNTGRRIPVSISTAILRDAGGRIMGGAETFRDLSVEEELKLELQGAGSRIITHSPVMQKILTMLPDIAASDGAVMITGETGTGKELAARSIHAMSQRKNAPFIAVNCGALPETLLESELFGYEKGAFTDAKRDKPGRIALAEGGTLFLDEVGDLSPALQVKLLRFLQEKTYEPLGAVRTVAADVRIISATNRDIDILMESGSFRSDLYYRINVLRLDLPPLRQRPEDILMLADHFIQHFNRLRGREVEGLSPQARSIILTHEYPGNVRELENIIEHAFALCRSGPILPEHLPPRMISKQISASRNAVHASINAASTPTTTGRQTKAQYPAASMHELARRTEAKAILDALEQNNYNRAAAADQLGIHKSTLYRKISRLGLKMPENDGRSSRRA